MPFEPTKGIRSERAKTYRRIDNCRAGTGNNGLYCIQLPELRGLLIRGWLIVCYQVQRDTKLTVSLAGARAKICLRR